MNTMPWTVTDQSLQFHQVNDTSALCLFPALRHFFHVFLGGSKSVLDVLDGRKRSGYHTYLCGSVSFPAFKLDKRMLHDLLVSASRLMDI
jgi:hypothetical protein